MAEKTEGELVTKQDLRKDITCEGCGRKAPRRPLEGLWSMCGRSRRLVRSDVKFGRDPSVSAWWCEGCDPMNYINPTTKEIRKLQRILLGKTKRLGGDLSGYGQSR